MNHSAITFDDLEARLLNLVEKARAATMQLDFRFAVADVLRPVALTSIQGMNLFRAMQEAVNNAIKYAGATLVSIDISQTRDIEVVIADNGRGFDTTKATPGNGIVNMQKRMADAGGSLSIASSPGKGTTITLHIPFDSNQNDRT
jgi:signal transduction histidine kinase